FVAQGTWTKQELEALVQKQQLVHNDDNPSCPLCEQNLSATRKRFLKKRFEDQEQFLTHRLGRLKKVSLALKELLVEQHARLQEAKKAAQEHESLQLQKVECEKKVVALQHALVEYKKSQE